MRLPAAGLQRRDVTESWRITAVKPSRRRKGFCERVKRQRTSRKARAEQGHRAQRRTLQRSHAKFKTPEKASFRAVVVGKPDCSEL